MRFLKTLALLTLLLTLPAVVAFSQHLKDPNAALRYMMIIGFMPDFEKNEEEKLIDLFDEAAVKKLPQSAKNKIREAQSQRSIDLLKFAAECPDCNFMPDQSFKPSDYVPPYRTLRRFARYLNAGAWQAIADGNHEKGAGMLVSVFRFGDHCENYGPMISYSIGLAIRNIALESMKNFLAGDYKAEAKEVITDYLKSLPIPAYNVKDGLIWEMKFSETIIDDLSKTDEGLLELVKEIFPAEETANEGSAEASDCVVNQRILLGALEMAAMDGIKFEVHEFAAIQERLIKDQYLRKPLVCGSNGQYKLEHYLEDGVDCFRVSCSCGADPENPPPATEPAGEKTGAKSNSDELKTKAQAYKSSGKLEKDRKELLEYYQLVIDIDPMQEGNLSKIEEIQKDYEKRDNPLIKTIAINFIKAIEGQIKLQKEIEALLK